MGRPDTSFLLSAGIAQAVRVLAVAFVGSSPTVGIFPYVAKAVERVRAVAFVNKLRYVGIFPYVANAFERVRAEPF